jgi:hypothetical protein
MKGVSMKKIQGMKQGLVLMALICLISMGAVSTTGCAGKTTSTVTETTNGTASGGTNTTSVTTQTSAHPRGVIGGLFYTLGQVILFPFKVIGSLFT